MPRLLEGTLDAVMTGAARPRLCKDCRAELGDAFDPRAARPAPHEGPRCATHWRKERDRRKAAEHAKYVLSQYGITEDDYQRLLRAQGGRCAICQKAKGISKRLAVDHDHKCCPGPTSCGRCVRGLLCGFCNDLLSIAGDQSDMLYRAIDYLRQWPSLRAGV